MALTLTIEDGEFRFSGRSINITKEKNKLLAPHNKQIWNYGIVLELAPTEEQLVKMKQTIGCARFVHNSYLDARKALYDKEKKTLTSAVYKKDGFKKLKEKNPWLNDVDSTALADAIECVDAAYDNFFKKLKNGEKCGFPKPWSKAKPNGSSYTSKCSHNNIRIDKNRIKLPKIGMIRFYIPKGYTADTLIPEGTRILSAVVSNYGGRYTVSLQLETIIDLITPVEKTARTRIWSADMGIKDFCILGNEELCEKIGNPRWIKVHSRRLRRLQQSLSRKVKGSKNREKAKLLVSKEHRKIKNQRKDFHHKLSRYIADHADVFICEDLNIKGMVKNHRLAKEISSCGWGQFLTFVKYKIEKKCGIFVKIGRFFPSSKTCSSCGHKLEELDLATRSWICPACGAKHDRDVNAQKNILGEGIRILQEDGFTVA